MFDDHRTVGKVNTQLIVHLLSMATNKKNIVNHQLCVKQKDL